MYHSSNLLSRVNSSWTSKPPLAVKYRFDAGSLERPGGPKSLCSTLDRLLAWENKLCQEVKVSFRRYHKIKYFRIYFLNIKVFLFFGMM